MRRVYFDNSATTPTNPEVAKLVAKEMTDNFGNPSSIHYFGREAHKVVDTARQQVAALIGADSNEIFFTSGGTESDNLALKGVAFANRAKGNHIITTQIEHHAILHTCKWLETQGFEVTYLPVDENAMVSLDDVKKAITDKTILISVMYANNEVGTVEPIREIGKLAHDKGIYFHTDAVQAAANVPIDVNADNIDLLSMSGHKFNAPKGIGVLYIRRGVHIEEIQQGGSQERKMRAGTENVPAIAGIGLAAEIARKGLSDKIKHLTYLRDKLINGIEANIPDVKLNGHPTQRMPGNVNFSFRYVEGESMLLNLDLKGIAASSGSACTSGSLEPSHVLMAMGMEAEVAHGSLRLSLGVVNNEEDVDYFLDVFPGIIEKLRSMSPLAKH